MVADAAEAAGLGAVYVEGIFSPAERVSTGVSWDALFEGYCDGAQQALEDHGVTVRLTPDIHWGVDPEQAVEVARRAVACRDRGVVGLGAGGREGSCPPATYARAFSVAKEGGLGSVPHAGEAAGPESVRAVLDDLAADRVRHGIRAIEDPGLLDELVARGTVLDVCPTSNVRTRVVASIDEHPLPRLVAAGVACSVSTDDPAMFGTDLGAEYRIVERLRVDQRTVYDAGVQGALCERSVRELLEAIGRDAWPR